MPKSTDAEHIKANIDIFDFALTKEELTALAALDSGKGKHDPEAPGIGEMLSKAYIIED